MVPFAFLIFICCQFALTIAEWEKFVAASSSDLTKLFEKEVSLISDLYHWTYLINEGKILRTSEIEHDLHVYNKIDADLKINQWVAENPYEYVSHPINAFHLMQRTTQLWPSVFENATTKSLEEIMEETVPQFPDEDDFLYGACVGLVNIELYYGSNGNSMLDLAMGKVFDPVEKKIYQAKHSLSSKDFYLIANAAKRVWRVDKYVEWVEGAYEVAKIIEKKSSMELRNYQREIMRARAWHDDILLEYGVNSLVSKLNTFTNAPDSQPSAPLFTALEPYDEELEEVPSYTKSKNKYLKEIKKTPLFINIRDDDKKDGRFMDKSFYRMRTAMLDVSKKLCNGDMNIRPAKMEKDLKCTLLHYDNAYLKMGPFKYELISEDPHIGLFRGIYSPNEVDELVKDSQDNLHSTTYSDGKITRYYTSQRSSKRRHVDDEENEIILSASKRLSLATRWMVHQRYTASEHYHVINYGIGGQIEVHVDYWGPGKYETHPGGDRIVTLLGYATTPIGGRTIFPSLGLTIKPEKGDSLFWLTLNNNREFDTRMYHMGCPVIYGHKWLLTKWLYSDDQMFHHPCSSTRGENFPAFSNKQRFVKTFNLELDE